MKDRSEDKKRISEARGILNKITSNEMRDLTDGRIIQAMIEFSNTENENYQKVEDENTILKDQIISICKNANDKVESLEQRNVELEAEVKRLKEIDPVEFAEWIFDSWKDGGHVADGRYSSKELYAIYLSESKTK